MISACRNFNILVRPYTKLPASTRFAFFYVASTYLIKLTHCCSLNLDWLTLVSSHCWNCFVHNRWISVMVIVFFDILLRLLRLCYVQSLTGHKSPVTAVSASETTGDIATVCDSGDASLFLKVILLFYDESLAPRHD